MFSSQSANELLMCVVHSEPFYGVELCCGRELGGAGVDFTMVPTGNWTRQTLVDRNRRRVETSGGVQMRLDSAIGGRLDTAGDSAEFRRRDMPPHAELHGLDAGRPPHATSRHAESSRHSMASRLETATLPKPPRVTRRLEIEHSSGSFNAVNVLPQRWVAEITGRGAMALPTLNEEKSTNDREERHPSHTCYETRIPGRATPDACGGNGREEACKVIVKSKSMTWRRRHREQASPVKTNLRRLLLKIKICVNRKMPTLSRLTALSAREAETMSVEDEKEWQEVAGGVQIDRDCKNQYGKLARIPPWVTNIKNLRVIFGTTPKGQILVADCAKSRQCNICGGFGKRQRASTLHNPSRRLFLNLKQST
ncbi:hypothetical protein C8R45DRAFT_927107 [Mycena sanguinolenta]|nr:hypothetical protein C8R45DRAFT_927107 [Mycena sanguinolenta]